MDELRFIDKSYKIWLESEEKMRIIFLGFTLETHTAQDFYDIRREAERNRYIYTTLVHKYMMRISPPIVPSMEYEEEDGSIISEIEKDTEDEKHLPQIISTKGKLQTRVCDNPDCSKTITRLLSQINGKYVYCNVRCRSEHRTILNDSRRERIRRDSLTEVMWV